MQYAIPNGKNPGNVWEVSTKAHYGNEHFAIFSEDLIARIITFATEKDPFVGRGTTGIVCALLGRNFTGIDLYPVNVSKAEKNIKGAMEGRVTIKLSNVVEIIPTTNNIPPLESYLSS